MSGDNLHTINRSSRAVEAVGTAPGVPVPRVLAGRRPVDWPFVVKGLADVALLIVTLVPAVIAWLYMPAFGLALGVPAVVMFVADRRSLPLWSTFVLGFLFFAVVRTFADETGIPWQSQYVIDLERLVGLGALPTAWLQQHFRYPRLDWLASWTYVSFFLAPFIAGFGLWLFKRMELRRFVTAAIVAYCLSLVVFFLLPTVPPWMASARGLIAPIDRIFVDTMLPTTPQIMEAGYRASANDVAAMPSMHMGMTLLAALAFARLHRVGLAVAVGYAALMLWAIVYLGEHYLVDGLAGMLLAGFAWWLAARITGLAGRRVEGSPEDSQAGSAL